jgi:hypothetical protein
VEAEKEQSIRAKQIEVFHDRQRKKYESEVRSKARFEGLRENYYDLKEMRSQIIDAKGLIKQE